MTIGNRLLIFIYIFCFTAFSIYSYAFLDINLTLSSFKPYLFFQKQMQIFGINNKPLSTMIFCMITILLFIFYYFLLESIKDNNISLKQIVLVILPISAILVFAYPSFSYDIYNYIFNAKMVLVYHANPHITAAWNFKDPMLDFMRNIHTPAPYFYGWTIISFLPYLIGIGRIFTEIISFKFFSFLLYLLTYFILKEILIYLKMSKSSYRLSLFLLNPFILIEAIAMGHNDFSMMAPALLSFYFLIKFKNLKKNKFLFFAISFLLLSISTKYATVVLIPFFIFYLFYKNFDIGTWGALALFLLPFSRPLDQLHSWYLIWPLTWSLLAKNHKVSLFFSILSIFALLRYAPYIWYGNWDPPVPVVRFLIYFTLPSIIIIIMLGKKLMRKT